MIIEDNENIYIDSKNDLKKLYKLKSSRYGSNSDIYLHENILLKIYIYSSLISEYYNIKNISQINTENVSTPKKIIYLDKRFSGYSMDYKKGVILPKVKENTNYDIFISNLDKIEKTIRIFSDKKIEMRDMNCFNILYDEVYNLFNVVDVDCYKENSFSSIEEIFINNLLSFEYTLLNSLSTKNNIVTTKLFNDLKYIINDRVNKNISIIETFKFIKDYLENYNNREINTIKDIRKVLKKFNN